MNDFGKLNFSTSFNPTSAFPIDARTVFDTYEDAFTAAQTAGEIGSTNTKYFYGMTLTVGTKKYVIQNDRTLIELVQSYTAEKILPDDCILKVGKMYFLGEITELTVGLPESAAIGDMVYLSFSTGAITPAVVLTTGNFIGLDGLIFLANRYYEFIGMWNGSVWVFAKNEVTL
ncbi:MAG: hypothetical protein IJ489_08905 [Clostridia bacterium]|nr:hypothetical protein [Clostridia bacterium]